LKKKQRISTLDEALEKISQIFREIESFVDVVIVEGQRDLVSLRNLSFGGKITRFSQVGISDVDFIDSISKHHNSVLILTDFDDEGKRINLLLSDGFERKGIRVEKALRRDIGRVMAAVGVYAIESLDNAQGQTR
jgi:5S rRNA maturation endonuclease (ribonuclease M5)